MMHRLLSRFAGAWLTALLSLTLSRLVFYLNLHSYFNTDLPTVIGAMLMGIRFDIVAVSFFLFPFFVALPFIRIRRSQLFARTYYMVMLAAMNLMNCIDAEFFKFTSRRSTADLFDFAFLSNDLFNIAPNLLYNFWYLLAALLAIIGLSWWLFGKVMRTKEMASEPSMSFWVLIPLIIVLIIGLRGGIQPDSLQISDAGHAQLLMLNSIVLNTPFTILRTFGEPDLNSFEYPQSERASISPTVVLSDKPVHGMLRKCNVVVIIVESLSLEYISSLNGLNTGFTPFVDSLCSKSLVFTNAFANGHRSIEGIPAVMGSLPTLMYEPFSTSDYKANRYTSLANLLRPKGYYSAFMHGGNKGSMNFESFAGHAGFDVFLDRDDYPFPDKHYDGYWGIYDHYFLKYCVNEFSSFRKPFVSGIFTLSSHHPYTIPEEFKDRFPKGSLPIHESMGYTDQALRMFFKKAATTDWYDNTLFVITADHTSLSDHPYYMTSIGSVRIPIVFFHPNDTMLTGKNGTIMQQADIMPTVLDLLGYDDPFFSLGVSVFDDKATHLAVAYKHDQYQMITGTNIIGFDGQHLTFVYDFKKDSLLRHDLLIRSDTAFNEQEALIKAYLQNYSKAMIENRMTVARWTEDR